MDIEVYFPEKLAPLWGESRYKVAYGGRGSGKSWFFARRALLRAAERRTRFLCCREIQSSIKESVHELLKTQITALGMDDKFAVLDTEIRCDNGSQFIFTGLYRNITKIKSMEDVDIAWVEEAESVSDLSWQVLIPTIRKKGSEIWVSFNPDLETDPTWQRFVKRPPPNTIAVFVNWYDNPWLPAEALAEKDYLYSVDLEAAEHVWGGKLRKRSKALILADKVVVLAFEPKDNWHGPYQGTDWGFAAHPTAMTRSWITGDLGSLERELWIEREVWGVGVDNDELPRFFDALDPDNPGDARRFKTRADASRPETINHMRQHGYPRFCAAPKWPGSVEDGIRHLRGYKRIVVHPRCRYVQQEAKLYSYKQDKLTGDVLPIIIPLHDDCWDATRYALAPVIQRQLVKHDGYAPAAKRATRNVVTKQSQRGGFRSRRGGVL